jgi:hypothetical protein
MNFKNLLVVISIVSIAIISCKSAPVNPEVENYIYKISPSLALEELPIIKKFDSIPVEVLLYNKKVDSILQSDILEPYGNFIKKLDTITIKDPELKEIHAKYIEYAKHRLSYYNAFLINLNGGLKNNTDTLSPIADKLIPLHDDYLKLLSNLVEKYQLEDPLN